MNSIEVSYKIDIKFMTSGNSKKHDPQRLLLKFSDKINLQKE